MTPLMRVRNLIEPFQCATGQFVGGVYVCKACSVQLTIVKILPSHSFSALDQEFFEAKKIDTRTNKQVLFKGRVEFRNKGF